MTFYSISLAIVGVYAGLNILINLFVAYRVSANRVRTNVMTGTGDDEKLYNASRAHITNVEYTPIGLIGVVLHMLLAPDFARDTVRTARACCTRSARAHRRLDPAAPDRYVADLGRPARRGRRLSLLRTRLDKEARLRNWKA